MLPLTTVFVMTLVGSCPVNSHLQLDVPVEPLQRVQHKMRALAQDRPGSPCTIPLKHKRAIIRFDIKKCVGDTVCLSPLLLKEQADKAEGTWGQLAGVGIKMMKERKRREEEKSPIQSARSTDRELL